MSQRRFKDDNMQVLTGWDRPLQHHFLMVTDLTEQEPDAYAYNSLEDLSVPMGGLTVQQVMDKLRELKVKVPPTLQRDLVEDMRCNRGNVVVEYDPKNLREVVA